MVARTLRKLNAAVDERVGTQSFLKEAFDHIFPDNWSFMLGEMAMYCFILLIATGIYLTMFYDPGDSIVAYHGSYVPLQGVKMPVAYETTVRISMDVRAGLLFRQMHHWACNLFMAALVVHLCRIFFTGAFRKPREINWLVGVTLLLCVMFEGFTGYSMPDDLLSGMGLRVFYSILLSVPVVGNWLAYLIFGGQFPSDQLTHRLYVAHILILPLAIIGLLGIHLSLIWRQKHTQFAGNGRTEKRLVGSQLWPTYAARSIGLFAATAGVIALLGGFAQINPIFLYGPYKPENASSASQPDWYVGFLEGSLRLFPAWNWHFFGYIVNDVFWAAFVFPLTFFAVLYAWPWIERFWTGDRAYHNLLERPRDNPVRTGIGVGVLTFMTVLTLGGGQDVIAFWLQTSQPPVTLTLRGMAIVCPFAFGYAATRICRSLATAKPMLGEHPEGSAGSATPDPERYLPRRAQFERDGEGDGAEAPSLATRSRRAADVGTAVGAGVVTAVSTGMAAGEGWRARRRRGRRAGGHTNGSGPS